MKKSKRTLSFLLSFLVPAASSLAPNINYTDSLLGRVNVTPSESAILPEDVSKENENPLSHKKSKETEPLKHRFNFKNQKGVNNNYYDEDNNSYDVIKREGLPLGYKRRIN